MNTSTAAAYPDVDAAAHVWDNTENSLSWDQRHILLLCLEAKSILASDDRSLAFKVGYAKAMFDFIEQSVKAKAKK